MEELGLASKEMHDLAHEKLHGAVGAHAEEVASKLDELHGKHAELLEAHSAKHDALHQRIDDFAHLPQTVADLREDLGKVATLSDALEARMEELGLASKEMHDLAHEKLHGAVGAHAEEVSSKLDDLHGKHAELLAAHSEKADALTQRVNDFAHLPEQLTNVQDDLAKVARLTEALEERFEELGLASKEMHDLAHEKLHGAVGAHAEEVQRRLDELHQLHNEKYDELHGAHSEKHNDLHSRLSDFAHVPEELRALREDLASVSELSRKMEDRFEELGLASKEMHNMAHDKLHSALGTHKDEMDAYMKELQRKNAEKHDGLQDQLGQFRSLPQQIDDLRQDLAQVAKLSDVMEQRFEEMGLATKDMHDAAQQRLHGRFASHDEQVAALGRAHEEAKSGLNSKLDEFVQAHSSKLTKIVNDLSAQVDGVAGRVDTCDSRTRAEMSTMITSLREEIGIVKAHTSSQIDGVHSRVDSHAQALSSSLNKALDHHTKQLDDHTRTHKETLQEQVDRIERVEEQLGRQLNESVDRLSGRVEEQRRTLYETLMAETSRVGNRVEESRRAAAASLQEEVTRLTGRLSEVERLSMETMTEERDRTLARVEEVKRSIEWSAVSKASAIVDDVKQQIVQTAENTQRSTKEVADKIRELSSVTSRLQSQHTSLSETLGGEVRGVQDTLNKLQQEGLNSTKLTGDLAHCENEIHQLSDRLWDFEVRVAKEFEHWEHPEQPVIVRRVVQMAPQIQQPRTVSMITGTQQLITSSPHVGYTTVMSPVHANYQQVSMGRSMGTIRQ